MKDTKRIGWETTLKSGGRQFWFEEIIVGWFGIMGMSQVYKSSTSARLSAIFGILCTHAKIIILVGITYHILYVLWMRITGVCQALSGIQRMEYNASFGEYTVGCVKDSQFVCSADVDGSTSNFGRKFE